MRPVEVAGGAVQMAAVGKTVSLVMACPVRIQLGSSCRQHVGGEHAIVRRAEIHAGGHERDVRIPLQFTLDPHHAVQRLVPVHGVVFREGLAGSAVGNQQRPDRPFALLPGQPGAGEGIDDAAREEDLLRRLEEAGVLHEERALLRKVHLEPLVDGHLGLVRLHLAEIGTDGDVEREGVLDDHFAVDPRASLRWRS